MLFFGSLFYSCILILNAICVLSEDRFLARINFASSYDPTFGATPDASVKARVVNLISSVRTVMRIPLIIINVIVIIYELILG